MEEILNLKRIKVLYAGFIVMAAFLLEYFLVKSTLTFHYIYFAILFLLLLKIGYIITQSFKSIVGIVRKGTAYHIYLLFIAVNAILIITSFGSDYFALQLIEPKAFEGMKGITNEFEIFFKMFYLSLLLFTNLGVADIVPATTHAEILVMAEGIVAFVSLIFMLSDYTTLKESFGDSSSK